MDMKSWRKEKSVTLAQLAQLCGMNGVNPGRDLHRYESGSRQAPAHVVERVRIATNGSVTAQDMHETRLAWLRENKPQELLPTKDCCRAAR